MFIQFGAMREKAKLWAMNTNALPDHTVPVPPTAPTWVLIVGVSIAVLTLLFAMYLVLKDRKFTKGTRGLIAAIFALTTALAFAFIGGYAKAEGKIPISEAATPIEFGVGGGIAVFVIVYGLLWFTWVRESKPSNDNDGIAMKILPSTTLRSAIEAAAEAGGKTVIYSPQSEKFDQLIVKEGRFSAETSEKLIELFRDRIVGTTPIEYSVEMKSGTNAIEIKITS